MATNDRTSPEYVAGLRWVMSQIDGYVHLLEGPDLMRTIMVKGELDAWVHVQKSLARKLAKLMEEQSAEV